MRIGLVDLGKKAPNLALMKLSTFHKQSGDEFVFPAKGDEDMQYVSCVFTKYKREAEYYASRGAVVGGPGWDLSIKLPPEIDAMLPDHSLYAAPYILGQLTKGCPGNCPWCIVPHLEGREAKTVATVGDLMLPGHDFIRLLDPNILACRDWPDHFQEIYNRGLGVDFTQGLDVRYVNEYVAQWLNKLKITNEKRTYPQIHFAWDELSREPFVMAAIKELGKAGIKPWRLMFYVLTGYNTTFEEDWYRVQTLTGLGCKVFVMVYEGLEGVDRVKKQFARYVNTFTYKKVRWEDYWHLPGDLNQPTLFW
ncbi:MAG: radical SAM protein [Bacillota bacterium]